MNINLDDNKIVKIVYRQDDTRVLEFNYKDGALVSVTTSFSPKAVEKEPKPNVMSDEEMIEAVKNSDFMDELKAAKNRYKLAKEIAEDFPEKDETPTKLGHKPNKNYSDESIDIIKKIIKLDEDGTLDEIAQKVRAKIDNVISLPSQVEGQKCDIDMGTCERSLDRINNDIMKTIEGINLNDAKESRRFSEMVDMYKNYLDKKKELSDKKWNLCCQEVKPLNTLKK